MIGLLGVIGPWVYDKYQGLGQLFIKNRPDRLPSIKAFKSHEIKYMGELRNCEDLVIDQDAGMALLSCDPGRDWWNTVMVCWCPLLLKIDG